MLSVNRKDDLITLDFPTDIYEEVETPQVLIDAFGIKPIEAYKGKTDYLLINHLKLPKKKE